MVGSICTFSLATVPVLLFFYSFFFEFKKVDFEEKRVVGAQKICLRLSFCFWWSRVNSDSETSNRRQGSDYGCRETLIVGT